MFPRRRPLELVTVSEGVMKSDPGANIKQNHSLVENGCKEETIKSHGHPLAELAQLMGRKTKTGCCLATNDNVSTVKLTLKKSRTQDVRFTFTPLYPKRI